MNLLKKVQFYRKSLQALFAFNIALITAGGIATVSYFTSISLIKTLTTQNSERSLLLAGMQGDLLALSQQGGKETTTYSYIQKVEALRFKLQAWPGTELAQIQIPENLENARLSPELIASIHERILKEQAVLRDQMQTGVYQIGNLAVQLGWLGLVTLLVGIILPIYVFKRLLTTAMTTKAKVEKQTAKWIAGWVELNSKHSEKPLQDPVFWLKIILLSVETMAPHSRHPAAQYLSEFAPTLRKEIENAVKTSEEHTKKSA